MRISLRKKLLRPAPKQRSWSNGSWEIVRRKPGVYAVYLAGSWQGSTTSLATAKKLTRRPSGWRE